MAQDEDDIVEWRLARCVLPYEGGVRGWLRRANVDSGEIDDIIQEAYSRIAELENLARVADPQAYFLQVARNILFDQLRRARRPLRKLLPCPESPVRSSSLVRKM